MKMMTDFGKVFVGVLAGFLYFFAAFSAIIIVLDTASLLVAGMVIGALVGITYCIIGYLEDTT